MIIGLSGYAGVGKDTLAKYIVELDPSFEIKKFSGKLKEVASLLTGIPVDNFENQKFKTQELNGWDMTVRELLQKLGTEAIRDGLHEDAWVNALFANYHQGENWVITDMRFPNEYEAVKRFGGKAIRLDREGIKPINYHPSETAIDSFDFDIQCVTTKQEPESWKVVAEQILNQIKTK